MECDECGARLYEAGERVPAGAYMRVDDLSFAVVRLDDEDSLPPSFDGHIAFYRAAAATCACQRRAATAAQAPHTIGAGQHLTR